MGGRDVRGIFGRGLCVLRNRQNSGPQGQALLKSARFAEELKEIIESYEGSDFVNKDIRKQVRNEVMDDMEAWHKDVEPEESYASDHGIFRHIHVNHGPVLEKSIEAVKKEIVHNEAIRHKYSTRFLSIKLLENDRDIERFVTALPNGADILAIRDREAKVIMKAMNEDCEQAITDAKYGFISGALKETFTVSQLEREQTTRVIDSIVTHRIWGYPIFFLFLYIMFEGTFVLGEYPMMGIEWLVEQIGNLVSHYMPEGPLKDLVIDGIIGGVGGVIVFLPNILILYFFISFLEDSGYMARAAFIMDKIMHRMGLHGKSFIPLIMGFGCNVPAIMASRMIEDRKCRLITMLVNPLMSCSARLPIYLVLIGAFFPGTASLVLLSIYAIGILLAVLMARLFSRFLVKGDDTPFVMELPPYRVPTVKTIFRHTWEKGAQYLKKMGGIIMIASILIWFLGYYPRGSYETMAEQQEHSYIGQIGKTIEPVIEPLGFDWKLGVGLLSGVGAKELVVSTLGVLYTNEEDIESVNLSDRIPVTPTVALGYMLFVLIYFPCVATLAAIRQESGSWKWALFAAFYTTALAWVVAYAVNVVGNLF
jgi:ferrous iron transport protein B